MVTVGIGGVEHTVVEHFWVTVVEMTAVTVEVAVV